MSFNLPQDVHEADHADRDDLLAAGQGRQAAALHLPRLARQAPRQDRHGPHQGHRRATGRILIGLNFPPKIHNINVNGEPFCHPECVKQMYMYQKSKIDIVFHHCAVHIAFLQRVFQ